MAPCIVLFCSVLQHNNNKLSGGLAVYVLCVSFVVDEMQEGAEDLQPKCSDLFDVCNP